VRVQLGSTFRIVVGERHYQKENIGHQNNQTTCISQSE
jgi:hypothetical protein